ncbi:MAG: penicillin acylase family protein, partial [Bacteroidia bacterium]|nr:penicillin acylase family protein [Bacteroidia bacterium]
SQPIAGNSSAYKWTDLVDYSEMPTLLNPECGYVYNCNQTPLDASGEECDWNGNFVGLHTFTYNRGERFRYLLENHTGKFSREDLLRIKFDKQFHPNGSYQQHFKNLYQLDENKYPDIADAIRKFKRWNLTYTIDNPDAALALVTHDYLIQKHKVPFALLMLGKHAIPETEIVEAVRFAKRFLLKTHKSLDIPYGNVHRHIRGTVSLPASGGREVARAADGKLFDKKKGIYRISGGDGYIQVVRYSSSGAVEIESINAYGASANPKSPHYTDQMERFELEQFKPMTLNKQQVLATAKQTYHPKVVSK